MAYARNRSKRQALLTGATDGKYLTARINTEVGPDNVLGSHLTVAEKQALNPLNGYQDLEPPVKVAPNTFG
jgi:hypothetical protein